MIANKKIEDLIRFFHAYHTKFNPRSRLIIVGVFSLFERYFAALTHMVDELALTHVHFTGHVSDAELVAYYEMADLFLCASEHEGFCVPLVEAFYKQVPVLAYAATAVPATMDGAGVLFDDEGPVPRGGADGRDPVGHRRCRTRSSTDSSRRWSGCRPKDFDGTLLRVRRADPLVAPRRGSRRSRSTSGTSSTRPKRWKRSGSVPAVGLQGAAGRTRPAR